MNLTLRERAGRLPPGQRPALLFSGGFTSLGARRAPAHLFLSLIFSEGAEADTDPCLLYP